MKAKWKDAKSLVPGDIFFHPVDGRPEAIWLVVCDDDLSMLAAKGPFKALSLSRGVLVDIGTGRVVVVENVDFLERGESKMTTRMKGGDVFMYQDDMVGGDMIIKTALGEFFSWCGRVAAHAGLCTVKPKRMKVKYPLMEVRVGLEGQMKPIKDFGFYR